MSTDAHKQKAQAKLDEQKAALASAKAKLSGLSADARLGAESQFEALEKHYEDAKKKMAELADAGEDAWKDFAESLEGTWKGVAASLKKLVS